MQTTNWRYVGQCEVRRRRALENPLPFADVVSQLQSNMKMLCFHRDPLSFDTSYSRAIFCIKVDSALFDACFNSSLGYRGAYFVSPECGLEANRFLINQLLPQLTSWANEYDNQVDKEWLVESLSLISAKAWLAEETLNLCNACSGEWSASYNSDLRIENGRWELCLDLHAVWGRQAPELTKIRIFGGFVNSIHQEWVAERKKGRAGQIWKHGWS